VNHNTLLGSLDGSFLNGTGGGGNLGSMVDTSIQSLIGDLTSLIRDLTSILGSLVGTWSSDGENGQNLGSLGDWSGNQGSVGGLDDGGKHHQHHHDIWNQT